MEQPEYLKGKNLEEADMECFIKILILKNEFRKLGKKVDFIQAAQILITSEGLDDKTKIGMILLGDE